MFARGVSFSEYTDRGIYYLSAEILNPSPAT
jgi:hypothetical protein